MWLAAQCCKKMSVGKGQKVACVGAGVIGSGFALNFAWKGYPTAVYDVRAEALDAAAAFIEKSMETLEQHGVLTKRQCGEIRDRIHLTTDMEEALRGAEFVQESGPEQYDIKQSLLAQIESFVAEDTVIASSTSGLLITKMAAQMTHPERLVGGHPYNPPHLIPLVEVIKGEKTVQNAVDTAYAFYKSCGKEPVVLNKEVNGFISNRLQMAVFREMIDLVDRGVCSFADADKALLYGLGLRWGIMGPGMVFHLGAGDLGIGGMMERQKDSSEERLRDMAVWTQFPDNLGEICTHGIQEEIAQRSEEEGRTIPEIVEYRDKMLLALLKLHHKI